jgi:hypothetical protein
VNNKMVAASSFDAGGEEECFIPLSSFGGPKVEEILEHVGIEAVLFEYRRIPPLVMIVRRYPAGNPLASFLRIYLNGKYSNNSIDYGDIEVKETVTKLKLAIDELLEEKITGEAGYGLCDNNNCVMPIIGRETALPLSQKVKTAASRALVHGIKRLGGDIDL